MQEDPLRRLLPKTKQTPLDSFQDRAKGLRVPPHLLADCLWLSHPGTRSQSKPGSWHLAKDTTPPNTSSLSPGLRASLGSSFVFRFLGPDCCAPPSIKQGGDLDVACRASSFNHGGRQGEHKISVRGADVP